MFSFSRQIKKNGGKGATGPPIQSTTIDGKKYVEQITKQYYNDSKDHNNIQIPAQKDESDYTIDALSEQQQAVVLASIDTIVKILNNDTKYNPLRAIVMGCGGTETSFIINTIISIVQKMMQQDDTIQVGAPTGAAAFNIEVNTALLARNKCITP